MNAKKVSVLALIFSVSVLFFSCSSYEQMFEKFNGKFSLKPTDHEYSVDTSDFDESEMLAEVYDVYSFGDLTISAPKGCESYEWKIEVPASVNTGSRTAIVSTERILTYKMPGILSSSVINELVLTVQDEQGNTYTDRAKIILN